MTTTVKGRNRPATDDVVVALQFFGSEETNRVASPLRNRLGSYPKKSLIHSYDSNRVISSTTPRLAAGPAPRIIKQLT